MKPKKKHMFSVRVAREGRKGVKAILQIQHTTLTIHIYHISNIQSSLSIILLQKGLEAKGGKVLKTTRWFMLQVTTKLGMGVCGP